MADVANKVTGNTYIATEFNQNNSDIKNVIANSGQTPSSSDAFQISKAVANYSAHGDHYTDSGAADAYVLAAQGSKQAPTAYADGLRVRFTPGNTNTGASTINVASLGVKNIKTPAGNDPVAGDIEAGLPITVVYDFANGRFYIYSIAIGGTTGQGALVQVVNTQDGEVATGTTLIPMDDTIPQNTEGDEYMTLAITPKNASNILEIEVRAFISSSAGSGYYSAALFQDATASALASSIDIFTTTDDLVGVSFKHRMVAGTTSSTTFKVRAGADVAGTITFNGFAGARKHGGVLASSITINEIRV
jgi:hypothetical protein